MTDATLKVVKVFIASPGGLEKERKLARQIVDQINSSHSEHWGCQIQLVGWEGTTRGFDRAQSIINAELDRCQYFVGVIWKKWGTPPNDEGAIYSSGFEEEYERARSHHETGQMQNIFLFFKKLSGINVSDMPDVGKVINFREQCVANRKPFFSEFKTTRDFENMLRKTIEHIGWSECALNTQIPPDSAKSKSLTLPEKPSDGMFDASSVEFLNELVRKPSDFSSLTSLEVARLRLIASSTRREGNDELTLGVHDANLIYARRTDLNMPIHEIGALIRAGISNFAHNTAPLWYWLAARPPLSSSIDQLALPALFGSEATKLCSIQILQCLGRTPHSVDFLSDDIGRKQWFRSSDRGVKAGAINFYKTNGTRDDLALLRTVIAEVDETTKSEIANAIISIEARNDMVQATAELINLNPQKVDADIASILITESRTSDELRELAKQNDDAVRRKSCTILFNRAELTKEEAQKYLTHEDLHLRLIGVKFLENLDIAPPTEIAKTILTPPKKGKGLFGALISARTELFDEFLQFKLSRMSFDELGRSHAESYIFDNITMKAYYGNFGKEAVDDIRFNLDDRFSTYFELRIDALARDGVRADTIKSIRDLEKHLCDQFMNIALNALCTLRQRQDLNRVRSAIDTGDIEFSDEPLQYLSQFGDWNDVARILELQGRARSKLDFMFDSTTEYERAAARALHLIGCNRISDLFAQIPDSQVKLQITLLLSDVEIRNLDDDDILREFRAADRLYRKTLALRCAQALPQFRLSDLIEKYVTGSEYFYDCVHWLDLGASLPREVCSRVADFHVGVLRNM